MFSRLLRINHFTKIAVGAVSRLAVNDPE